MVPVNKGKVLFNGESSEAICVENPTNYKKIKIIVKSVWDSNHVSTIEIMGPYENQIVSVFDCGNIVDNFKIGRLKISNDGIRETKFAQITVNNITTGDSGCFRILKIIGYNKKEV